MMRDGPIPLFAHGVIEYAAGALFITAPFLLSFDSGAATALSIVLGVVVLGLAAATDGPTSLVDQVPRSAHVTLGRLGHPSDRHRLRRRAQLLTVTAG